MQLHDPDSSAELDTAISSAREIAAILRLHLTMKEERPSVSHRCMGGTYNVAPMFWTADRLARGARVLRKLGRDAEASVCEEDQSTVKQWLSSVGVNEALCADGLVVQS